MVERTYMKPLITQYSKVYFEERQYDYLLEICEHEGKPYFSTAKCEIPKCNKNELRYFAESILKMLDKGEK